jgi:hypothetical protein
MNISAYYSDGRSYVNCECVNGFAFRYAALWVKSALLPVICAILAQLREYCVHLTVSNTSCRTKIPPGSADSYSRFMGSTA